MPGALSSFVLFETTRDYGRGFTCSRQRYAPSPTGRPCHRIRQRKETRRFCGAYCRTRLLKPMKRFEDYDAVLSDEVN